MNIGFILLIVLLVLLFGGAPQWGYHNYGYYPSGGVGILIIVLVVILLTGRG